MSGRQVGRYHDSIGVSTYLRFELAGLSCYRHGRDIHELTLRNYEIIIEEISKLS